VAGASWRWCAGVWCPPWAKEPSIGSKMINARAEGIATKPAFRAAFRQRRCLVPADGFYEWRKLAGGGRKQPVLSAAAIARPSPSPACGSAGAGWTALGHLHDRHHGRERAAGADPRPDAGDPRSRRPRRLARPRAAERRGTAALLPAAELEAVSVSTRVNSPRHDDATLLEPEGEPVGARQRTLI